MRKMEFHGDSNAVSDFIKEMEKLFPNHKIDINNVNDFSIMYTERQNCLNCKGLNECKNNSCGNYTDLENDHFVIKECKYKKAELANKNTLIKTLYMPEAILAANIESYDTQSSSRKKIYKHITEYFNNLDEENFQKGLYLYGSFTKGKTYSLAMIAKELAKNNKESLLIYFPDLVLDLKNALGTSRFEDLINMLKSVDVLMLDDLGAENITPWIRDEILGPVINYRLLAKKPLYVSSNITPKDLISHLAIDNLPNSTLKAERIVTRLQSLLQSIDMNDSKTYKR